MGFKSSPFLAIRYLSIASEYAVGDPADELNPFHWSKVVLNLPCSEKFNLTMPWIYEWNERAKVIAGDFVLFVDDFRIVGYLTENCWNCAQRLSSRLQQLGIQEVACKRSAPSLRPDAWAGHVAQTAGVVTKLIT